MGAIYQKVTLAWQGKEYEVQPDFRMVQRIESRGISLVGMLARMGEGDPQISKLAEVIAMMLRSGGAARVTAEEVYHYLMRQNDPDEMQRIMDAVTVAFFPTQAEASEGNGEAVEGESPPDPDPTTTT